MKSNELKIGNYANINVSNGEEIVKITKGLITSIEKDCVYINDIKVELRFLEPIQLTEEILLKCVTKFKGINHRSEIWIQGECFEFFVNENYFHLKFTGGEGVSFSVPIKYLHQLQNLYFSLTNEELIINL